MARINHGPRHRRRRRHREACLLIKQRPSPPVKVLLPLPTVPSTPPPVGTAQNARHSSAFLCQLSNCFPIFCWTCVSTFNRPLPLALAQFFFGLFSASSFFLHPSRGLFCYFCQSQCQIAKALQLVDFCSFCEAFVADLAQQK